VPPVSRPIYAIAMRLGSAALLAVMLLMIKLAGESGVALPEIMFWRQALSLPILLAWLALNRDLGQLRTQRITLHGLRALAGMTGMVLNFGATLLLPLAISTSLTFSAPLFAVLIAALILRERVGLWRWSAVLLGFAGVLVIVQPGHLGIDPLGAAMAIGAAAMIAMINYQVRDLGRTEPPIRIVFWFALFGALLMLPLLPFYAQPQDLRQWFYLAVIGLFGTLGQVLLTTSLRFGAVATVIVFDYTSLIWATLFGWLVWHHLPGLPLLLGAPLIVAAGLIVVWREQKLYRRLAPTGVSSGD
jgi:drug/metabolite transporter (DMT)-like permease